MYRLTLRNSLMFLVSCMLTAEAGADGDPLFADDEPLVATIEAPLTSIMKERPLEEYVAGTFTYIDDRGSSVEFDVGLRTRGRFRRRAENCEFAPLRINFKKSAAKGTLFHKQDKLKLVTHCQNRSRSYQQAVVSEYLAYRIYSLLTEISFRARLLEVTYIDTDRDNRELVSYAILIEHKDRMAKRIDIPSVAVDRITIQMLVPEHAALTGLFQYFLGNTDFSPIATAPGEDCCHNHELFANEGQMYYSVPYDFDMTGFVNAPHSQPSSRFGLRSVRQRLYRGRCLHNDLLPRTIEAFEEQREAIYELVHTEARLTKGRRRSLINFIDDFFDTLDSEKKIRRDLYKKCL